MADQHELPPGEHEREAEEDEAEHATLIAIVLLLLAALPPAVLAERLAAAMAKVGVSVAAVAAVLSILGTGGLVFAGVNASEGVGSAEAMFRRTAVTRRARYILAASKRLSSGGSPSAERRLFNAHLAAEKRRIAGARRVDQAVKAHGPLLGWHSERDGRTTKECFAAHGSNFSALRPPSIGWPGTLHGGNCRCRPVAPWPGGDMLP